MRYTSGTPKKTHISYIWSDFASGNNSDFVEVVLEQQFITEYLVNLKLSDQLVIELK